MHEAGKYGVFPMLRFPMHGKPENLSRQYAERMPVPEKIVEFKHVRKPVDLVYSRNITSQAASHIVTAHIHRDFTEQDGVLYSNGQRFGGITFYIKDNHLKYVYNANKESYYNAVSDIEVPLGAVEVAYSFIREPQQATVTLYINGHAVGTTVVQQFAYMIGFTSTLGGNHYSPVTPDYEVPFAFKGRLDYIRLHQFASTVNPKEELEKLLSVE